MVINEPEDGRSYGMAAVTNWVDEDDFPTTKADLESRFGDREVMLDYQTTTNFSDVLEEVDEDEFEEMVDLWKSLGKALRRIDPPFESSGV
ncbi:MAG: DUF5785 family protein [Halobacteria archaeon]|nr:DUF5785 family protein [Halobacteria archaeon]